MLRHKKILITGGLGLVGSILYKSLQERDKYDVYIIDRVKPKKTIKSITFIHVDITNYYALLKALETKNFDVIVHLAAVLENNPVSAINKVNYLGTKNIFKAAAKCGVKRIVYASSVLVMYGYRWQNHSCEVTELNEVKPPEKNFELGCNHKEYAKSKIYGEQLCKEYSEEYPISCLVIRFGWVNKKNLYNHAAPNWCSHEDARRILLASINADQNIKHLIAYGVSDNPNRYFSLDNFNKLLGVKK